MKLNKQKVDNAIESGKTHIYSIVKSFHYTTYYHVVPVLDVVKNGYQWIPAPFVTFESGAHGRCGVSNKPDNSIQLCDLR